MAAPSEIEKLVERFDRNREQYLSPGYNETELRQEFLNPFFSALGWDIENRQGYAEPYKDVIHEDAIKVGSATKAPDYSFRIGGMRKFFVEAKRPSVRIKEDAAPAFQLRRYAWSAKLPLSLLTDFEEFAVYDCRIKPTKHDSATVGRLKYFTFADYIPHWDDIASVFSREAVLTGSFDKYADSAKGKKGTTEVDDAFLKEIESWRDQLARNIAIRNPKLTQRELNFAVQKTIDRIIFLRICEDRGIETYGSLQALVNGERTYKRLCEQFYRADEKYNSGLFHFQEEKDRGEAPDSLTLDLHIDDKPLIEIIGNLYYPDCPYEFSVLPADILGQVYEQFLGKVIRLTAGHQAKVEDKPEVKKAGGVYYTPTYIVDYIVKNTVGKLVEEKTPKQIVNIHVLDPACGSGSFLIGAYQCLLNWHRDWYVKDGTEKWAKGKNQALYQGQGGDWRLTTSERKRILLNNIYGVDIDSQAVEVTKLSLLLKVLEGENEETISQQLKMFHERALPDLGSNIKCGNSLIGPDFYEGGQLNLLDDEEKTRINVFDWKTEFKEIMDAGGFDVVIGNPPYIRIQAMKEWAPIEVEAYKNLYRSASQGNYDIYVVFVERGLSVLRQNGRLGFILPHKFFNAQYGEMLRSIISRGQYLTKIIHFGDQQVFANASTYTCLLFLAQSRNRTFEFGKVADLLKWEQDGTAASEQIEAKSISSSPWQMSIGGVADLLGKLQKQASTLSEISEKIFQGLVTSSDPVYLLDPISESSKELVRVYSNATNKEYVLERSIVPPLCKGSRDIRRYRCNPSKRVIFPYDPNTSAKTQLASLISPRRFAEEFPKVWDYLKENEATLRGREKGKMRHEGWYGYVYPKSISLFTKRKLLTPSIAAHSSFTYDPDGSVYFVGSGGGGGGAYGILLKPDCGLKYEYVLGLLNSRLLDYFLKQISTPFRGGFYAFNRQYIELLPIKTIRPSSAEDKSDHDRMVGMVESMLKLHKDLTAVKTDQEKTVIQRQIDAKDKQIDALVYELYGLTEEEIKIVETAT